MRKRAFWATAVTLEILALLMGAGNSRNVWGQEDKAKEEKKTEAPAPKVELPAPDADGFINLFNGKDLTGWEGLDGYWSVKDGAIQGDETKANSKQTFLVLSASRADPAQFADFELRLKYKFVLPDGNSGVQFRSQWFDDKKGGKLGKDVFRIGGYQADFDGKSTYDGGMYDEADVAGKRGIMGRGVRTTIDAENKKKTEPLPITKDELKSLVKKGDWNDLVINVNKSHMKLELNGKATCEVIDESPKALKDGLIGFQLHSGYTMTIQFKDVKIKFLN